MRSSTSDHDRSHCPLLALGHEAAPEERRTGAREYRIFLVAIAVVGIHLVDDNYLQPEPGTSAGDHLPSGLVPLAALGIVAALYSRLRPRAGAYVSMTLTS